MENIFLKKYVDDVVVEIIDIDPVTNNGTIKLFDGEDVTIFTRKLVNDKIEIRNSDDEIVETDNLSWLFVYGVHDIANEDDIEEQKKLIAAKDAEIEEKFANETPISEEIL